MDDEHRPANEHPLSGAEMLGERLRELVASVHGLDPLVRARAENSVHDLRVTIRRLRGTLASYAPAFRPGEAEPIRAELHWFGAQLGAVRDSEVQAQRLSDLDREHGGDLARRTTDIRARLDATHQAALESLLAAMDSARYTALLAGLDRLADDPPFSAAAQDPAADLVRARAYKDWRRVRERVSRLPTPQDEEFPQHLHEVRKSAKRLQYLLESGRRVTGDDAVRFRRLLTKFQQRLGDHHDATLTEELLAEVGEPDPTIGGEAAAVASEFPTLWRRVTARARRWLH